ncbi:secreted RxLR effector protein 161-like [Primulina eburnea]|uniref:secreted RxLR effector protein 161-like n=1 Tax=Primulina eburnea TaxID=1245227 RepID=UPI003C6CAA96
MEESKRGYLPMFHGVTLYKSMFLETDEDIENMNHIPYASAIGSSIYQSNPSPLHWKAVKDNLKYLRRTMNLFLVYGCGKLKLEGYTDYSFQSDVDDSKLTSGFVFNLNCGDVSCKSFKQDTTAGATTEAEYIAASATAKEGIWMRNFIKSWVSFLKQLIKSRSTVTTPVPLRK